MRSASSPFLTNLRPQSRDSIDSITVKSGVEFQSRFGHFRHDDMVGKAFGSKVSTLSVDSPLLQALILSLNIVPIVKWSRICLLVEANSRTLVSRLP